MKKNILITGVAGLIGSRFSDWIAENKKDINIIGVDDLSGGYIENINTDKVKFHKLKLGSDDMSKLFEKYKFDYVFHFAAYAAEGLSPFIRKYNYNNNLIATADIINNCIKYSVKRLVFTSTMAVYGKSTPPFDETIIPSPIDPYGIAKYACELDIKCAGEQHGLDWCIIRPHNVYGLKQNIWDKYRNVLGIWMYQHINNMPLTIFGDGLQTRAFSFIDDILPCIWMSATSSKSSKQIINLGGKKHISIKESCEMLIKIMGGGDIVYKEQRHEVKDAYVTWKKSVDILDYDEKHTFEEGLSIMWNWAKQQPNRKRFVWSEYEIEEGIYSFWKTDNVPRT